MAKKKVEVVAEFSAHSKNLTVWCDATEEDFLAIEGIARVVKYESSKWFVVLDPRYDGEAVRQEIITRFSVTIPDVFKEVPDE